MFLKPKEWVIVPKTKYEMRHALNVRESIHTAMLFDKRYQNIDTGKFDSNKLSTINAYLLGDIVHDSYTPLNEPINVFDERKELSSIFKFPKFVPKDNDFDEDNEIIKEIYEEQINIEKGIKTKEVDERIIEKEIKEKQLNIAKTYSQVQERGSLKNNICRRIVTPWRR